MTFLQCLGGLFARPAVLTEKPTRSDANDIARAVYRHCQLIGCDESNTIAALAWALKDSGHTLAAIRAGNKRADQLRHRQLQHPTHPPISA